ncbi:unnamed protein product, partial [Trichogramma brassicae]
RGGGLLGRSSMCMIKSARERRYMRYKLRAAQAGAFLWTLVCCTLAQQKPSRLSALVSFLAVQEDFLDTNARLGRHRLVSRAQGPYFLHYSSREEKAEIITIAPRGACEMCRRARFNTMLQRWYYSSYANLLKVVIADAMKILNYVKWSFRDEIKSKPARLFELLPTFRRHACLSLSEPRSGSSVLAHYTYNTRETRNTENAREERKTSAWRNVICLCSYMVLQQSWAQERQTQAEASIFGKYLHTYANASRETIDADIDVFHTRNSSRSEIKSLLCVSHVTVSFPFLRPTSRTVRDDQQQHPRARGGSSPARYSRAAIDGILSTPKQVPRDPGAPRYPIDEFVNLSRDRTENIHSAENCTSRLSNLPSNSPHTFSTPYARDGLGTNPKAQRDTSSRRSSRYAGGGQSKTSHQRDRESARYQKLCHTRTHTLAQHNMQRRRRGISP